MQPIKNATKVKVIYNCIGSRYELVTEVQAFLEDVVSPISPGVGLFSLLTSGLLSFSFSLSVLSFSAAILAASSSVGLRAQIRRLLGR